MASTLNTKEEVGASIFGEHVPELVMSVVPKYRDNRTGTTTFRHLIEDGLSQLPGIVLSVRRDNPAIKFYEKLSFKRIPESQLVNRMGTESIHMYLALRAELPLHNPPVASH